ncbi:MAG: sodium:proton antiporter [Alicyclobacillaceae bacterium]|nr:sodium:proton antiporter [Alicyclobacillaceae bacterium]
MYGTAWSLVPFLVVIPVAMVARQVIPGLLAGLLVGAYMTHPTPLGGIAAALGYLLKELAIPDNLRLLVFLFGFGAFVGLVRVTGGVSGFARWINNRVRTVRRAFLLTWLTSLVTFMAPDFRIVTVAPVMRQVFQHQSVQPEKVALAIDITSTPLCAIMPVGTAFVGYMVGLIAAENRHHNLGAAPYDVFLHSLPLNFFSLTILFFGAIMTLLPARRAAYAPRSAATGRPHPLWPVLRRPRTQPRPPLTAESRLRIASQFAAAEAATEFGPARPEVQSGRTGCAAGRAASHGTPAEEDFPDPVETVAERVPPNSLHLLVPLLLLLGLTVFLTWWDGHRSSPTVWGAFAHANAAKAMLEALLITLVVSLCWYTAWRQPMQRTMFGFLAGGNEMMAVNVLLALVWAVSAVSADLGFVPYTAGAIGHLVPPALLAPALFVFGCLISYFIGSSFGTWGMLLPLGFSLAASTDAPLPLVAGAVFASGTFGGFASPLSDNTVAMATVMKLPVMRYARYKLWPALLAAMVAAVLYAVCSW